MTTAKRKRVDSLENAIEAALADGNFISYKDVWAFVDDLQHVANRCTWQVEAVVCGESQKTPHDAKSIGDNSRWQ